MKVVFLIASGTATAVCLLAATMCAVGLGTPNVGDGTLAQFYATLWGVTFAGAAGGIVIPVTLGFALRRVFG